jgi:hypothetical protein
MGTDKVTFPVERCGGATEVTWPEVMLVTWPEVTSVTWPVRKYALRMRNRKLRHIRLWGLLTGSDSHVTGRDPIRMWHWPEVCSAHDRLFPPRFFLSGSNMATGCDRRSLDPFGVPLEVRMCHRKLYNTCSDRRSRDPLEVSLVCSLRRPRPVTLGNPSSYI